ncbi:MAG: hypothetical protein AB1847_10190 [bacterium]
MLSRLVLIIFSWRITFPALVQTACPITPAVPCEFPGNRQTITPLANNVPLSMEEVESEKKT